MTDDLGRHQREDSASRVPGEVSDDVADVTRAALRTPYTSQSRQQITRFPLKVLIVDEDSAGTGLVCGALAAAGYQAVALNEPGQTLERVKQESCRVVVLDIDAPASAGLDALAQIKRYDPSTKVVITTGAQSIEVLVHAFHEGADFISPKPLDSELLIDQVDLCFRLLDHWGKTISALRRRARVRPISATP